MGCLAFGAEAGEQGGGRFVVRVLRHEFAGEGFFQDRLAQGFGFLKVGVDVGFERTDVIECRFYQLKQRFLFTS